MRAEVPQFDRTEFEHRLERLRAEMRHRDVQVMLVDDIEILAYFTGYERSISYYRACLLPLAGEPVIVLRALDIAPFKEVGWFSDCVGYADDADAVDAIAGVARERGWDKLRLGVDYCSHGMTVDCFQRLQKTLPHVDMVPMTGVTWDLRLIKSALEVKHLEAAARIVDQTLAEITRIARPGASGRDMAAFAARRYIELGASPGHVGPITYGKGWGFLHGHLHDTPLSAGDILHIELVPRFRGYSARLMRSVVMGTPTAAQLQVARDLVEIQDQQIAAMIPGALASDVDAILRKGVVDRGLRETYDNITGYTLGYYSQQPIRSSDFTRVFSPASKWRLESGMAFHMYTSAQGFAFSETVLIENSGPRRLTQLERKLYWSDAN